MTTSSNMELVLLMDSNTGELRIEESSASSEPDSALPDRLQQFHTRLAYDVNVAQKIRSALNRRGVKVKGVPEKCINISKDWLVQMLVLLYHGILDSGF